MCQDMWKLLLAVQCLSAVAGATYVYYNEHCSVTDSQFWETSQYSTWVECEQRTYDHRTRTFASLPSEFWERTDIGYVEMTRYHDSACSQVTGEWERFRLNYSAYFAAGYLVSGPVKAMCGPVNDVPYFYQEDQLKTKYLHKKLDTCLQGPNGFFDKYVCHTIEPAGTSTGQAKQQQQQQAQSSCGVRRRPIFVL